MNAMGTPRKDLRDVGVVGTVSKARCMMRVRVMRVRGFIPLLSTGQVRQVRD